MGRGRCCVMGSGGSWMGFVVVRGIVVGFVGDYVFLGYCG